MGNTPILILPYPEPSAFVKDGATAMKSLATAVDTARLDYLEMNTGTSQPANNAAWTQVGVGTLFGSRGTGLTPWRAAWPACPVQLAW